MKAAAHAQAQHAAVAAARPARLADLRALHALIRHYSDQNILLPRTVQDIRGRIDDFRVLSSEDEILACGILQPYTRTAAELRSLAVAHDRRGSGLGRQMVETLLAEARSRGLHMVFAFTTTPAFFFRLGFVPIERDSVPWKAWNDCSACPKRECCDEVAVAYWLKRLRGSPHRESSRRGEPVHFPIISSGPRS